MMGVGIATKFWTSRRSNSSPAGIWSGSGVPSRNLTRAMELEMAGPTYVGVSLEPGGTISYHVQREPFGYV